MGLYDSLKGAYDSYKRLNAAEKDALSDIILANPRNASVLRDAQTEALRWSQVLAGTALDGLPQDQAEARFKASNRNGPADAARHCYWSALLASKLSHNEAMRVVFTHEFDQIEASEALERLAAQMDLHNDRVGLDIGGRNKGASDVDLTVAVLQALFSGQLRQIDVKTGTLVPTKSLQPSM